MRFVRPGVDAAAPARRLHDPDQLNVFGHREEVECSQRSEGPTGVEQDAQVAGERGRLAGDVGDAQRSGVEPGEGLHDRAAGSRPRRIEHDQVRPVQPRHDSDRDRAAHHLHLAEPCSVAAEVRTGRRTPLDRGHRAGRPDGKCQADAEQPGAGVEVDNPLAGLHVGPLEHRPGEGGRGPGVDLPEHTRVHREPAPEHLEHDVVGRAESATP